MEIEMAKPTTAIANALPSKDMDPRKEGAAGTGNLQNTNNYKIVLSKLIFKRWCLDVNIK